MDGKKEGKGRLWNKGSAALKCDKVVETPVQIVFVESLRISSSLSILDKLGRPLWGLGALRDSGPSGCEWDYLIHDPFLDFPSKKTQKNILLVSGLRKEISPQKLPQKLTLTNTSCIIKQCRIRPDLEMGGGGGVHLNPLKGEGGGLQEIRSLV